MSLNFLKRFSYIYIFLPIILFILGWIKLQISIPIVILLMILIFHVNKDINKAENYQIINKKTKWIILGVMLIFCILAGQGGLFYQSTDHHWRNAIFRDMINMKWPVFYDYSNSYLDYYIGHWIIPAFIAKLFLGFSEEVAWSVGNICLLIWTTIGVFLSFIWLSNLIKDKKKIWYALLIFIFFSGMDFIGKILFNCNFDAMHLEWWAFKYQFSSMTTQLFWVFNQSTVAWLITMMVLNEKNVKNYFVLILSYLPYAPFPFVGAIPIFACKGIKFLIESVKSKEIFKFLKQVFSIQNVISLITILPIYYLYYFCNEATSR